MSTSPLPDLTRWIAGRFQLGDTVGEGGLSTVFAAWDHQLQRHVAVKIMNAQPDHRVQAMQTWREAMPASYLDHANIVRIYDYGVDEGRAYIVMELLEGETLEECLTRGPLHLGDFYRLARQSLEGLVAAHAAGFVHRDLKPGNFMLQRVPGEPFHVKILDFGLAKFVNVPRPQSTDHYNTLLGSIHYMAPEQFERRPVDVRTDLYSLGCIFYEALTSHNAFDADSVGALIDAHLNAWPQSLERLRPGLPDGLEDWVFSFLQKKPDARHQSAQDALDHLPKLSQSNVETQRLG
ncbi:MAG: serine/threonine-protein kinase [Verrucomicrobiota bacterium]